MLRTLLSMLFRTLGVLILALALSLGAASAAEARVFTLDFNDNGILELDGSDDLPFSFCGTSGPMVVRCSTSSMADLRATAS